MIPIRVDALDSLVACVDSVQATGCLHGVLRGVPGAETKGRPIDRSYIRRAQVCRSLDE